MMLKEGGEIIAHRVELADTFLKKVRGLMLRRLFADTALIFLFERPAVIRIHMLFVLFPIDLLFLDESMHILDLTTLKPFIGYRSSRVPVSFAVELPAGTIKRCGLKKGDKIEITDLTQGFSPQERLAP